jgi:hypothetical protein
MPRLLAESSVGAIVWYVRCEPCGHVFAIRQDTTARRPFTVPWRR